MANKSPAIQMKKLLDEFSKEVQEAMDDALKEIPKETAQMLRNTSAKKTGTYARGWAVKGEKRGAVVYNKTKPQLTHLLEKGHVIRNKKGTYGRTNGDGKIKEAETWASEAIVENIERRLD